MYGEDRGCVAAVLVTIATSIPQPISKAEVRQVTVTSHGFSSEQDDQDGCVVIRFMTIGV